MNRGCGDRNGPKQRRTAAARCRCTLRRRGARWRPWVGQAWSRRLRGKRPVLTASITCAVCRHRQQHTPRCRACSRRCTSAILAEPNNVGTECVTVRTAAPAARRHHSGTLGTAVCPMCSPPLLPALLLCAGHTLPIAAVQHFAPQRHLLVARLHMCHPAHVPPRAPEPELAPSHHQRAPGGDGRGVIPPARHTPHAHPHKRRHPHRRRHGTVAQRVGGPQPCAGHSPAAHHHE